MYKHTRADGGGNESKSGKLNEAFLLGDVTTGKNSAHYSAVLQRYIAEYAQDSRSTYIPYEASLELAREAQADNPKNPVRKFPHDLRHLIAEEWRATMKDGTWSIEIYSAVGTPFDIYHGVDAFVIIRSEDNKKWVITFDTTINSEKIAAPDIKANILIGDLPDPLEDEEAYYKAVRAVAKQAVAECLSFRVQQ